MSFGHRHHRHGSRDAKLKGPSATLKTCTCGMPLTGNTTACPYCGKRVLSTLTWILIWALILVAAVLLLWFFIAQADLAPTPN